MESVLNQMHTSLMPGFPTIAFVYQVGMCVSSSKVINNYSCKLKLYKPILQVLYNFPVPYIALAIDIMDWYAASNKVPLDINKAYCFNYKGEWSYIS